MTTIYIYNTETGEYKGEREAKVDPRTGLELLPTPNIKGKTLIAPMAPRPGYARFFNHDTQTWIEKRDWRGKKVYNKISGVDQDLDEFFDIDIPEGFTEKPRPSIWHNFDEQLQDWVEDTVAKEKYEVEESKDTDYSREDAEKKNIWDRVDNSTQAEFKQFLQDFIVDFPSAKRVLINVALEVARLRRRVRNRG